ncbi:MAG: 30S ribosomal protein S20 [Chlamydiota bacterium]
MAKEKKVEKKKRPTALKRDLQSEKSRVQNKQFRSRVNTAIRGFESALTSKDPVATKDNLSNVYSLIDKGVKTGIFKMNKANRMKSRLTIRTK